MDGNVNRKSREQQIKLSRNFDRREKSSSGDWSAAEDFSLRSK
ncbi:hypothetical protein [Mucilaginibacter sp.]